MLLLACSSTPSVRAPQRIGIPPELQGLFAQWQDSGPARPIYVALRPYERARDLEVLLFSTGSPVFSGIVLPGRWVPVIEPWSRPIDRSWLSGVRADVAACVEDSDGPLALPLTLDGIVMVYRADWWRAQKLPPPNSLAALREGVLNLRSRGRGQESPVQSEVPVEQLFWSLAWSYEGRPTDTLYSFPKVHALRFIQEFNLAEEPRAVVDREEDLLDGEVLVLFTSAHKASQLLNRVSSRGVELSVAAVPGQGGKSCCIYNGWCMASPQSGESAPYEWGRYTSEPFQDHLARRGWLSVLTKTGKASMDPVARAMDLTRFYPAPRLGDQGEEIVTGAILDATQGPMTPEEALRRAQARIGR